MSERPPKIAPNKRQKLEFAGASGNQVDANGIRHLRLPLTGDKALDQASMLEYHNLGYSLYANSEGLYVDMEIPQAKFLENEARNLQQAINQTKPKAQPVRDTEDGALEKETLQDLGAMSAEDLLGLDDGADAKSFM